MTPTGSEQVAACSATRLLTAMPLRLHLRCAPFPHSGKSSRTDTRGNGDLAESLLEAKARGIPVIPVNARLSEKSARGYQRLRWLSGRVLKCFDLIACQTAEHAQRFIELGVSAEKVQALGNVKYDLDLPTDLTSERRNAQASQRYWIAASTHPGEEEVVLQAHLAALESDSSLTLPVGTSGTRIGRQSWCRC